jgi:flagellin
MTVINTNTAASITANALTKNERAMSQAMERLSTGVRINNAGDDAAGLAISSKMTSQINGLNMAVRNANDAISLLQTADGAAIEISNMLQRMRELAVQGASGTITSTDRTALNTEFTALRDQIDEIANNTQWNGVAILDGNTTIHENQNTANQVNFHVGANASQTIVLDLGDFNLAAGAVTATGGRSVGIYGADISTTALSSRSASNTAITTVNTAIAGVEAYRAKFGSTINRLEYAADNLANVSQNTSASRSRILDTDYAAETTELARSQIIQQAATAMLSQANQQAQSVLALLK